MTCPRFTIQSHCELTPYNLKTIINHYGLVCRAKKIGEWKIGLKKSQFLASLLRGNSHSQTLLLVIRSCKLSLNSASLAAHLNDVLIDKESDAQIKNSVGSYSESMCGFTSQVSASL